MTQKLIQDRYQAVLDRIQKHSPEGKAPQLIAVSKTVGADQIQALYDLGQQHFGENRYPALLEKQAAIAQTAPDMSGTSSAGSKPVRSRSSSIKLTISMP